MKHVGEDATIAYQLNDSINTVEIGTHLENCHECAMLAESIAETLRVFSGEPIPIANVEHAWQRLRVTLPPLAPLLMRGGRYWHAWRFVAASALVFIFLVGFVAFRRHVSPHASVSVSHLSPGFLTEEPRDPQFTNHLASAERLLTEVGHSSGVLDATTRRQAQELLLTNTLYIQKAHTAGDLAEASILDDLGRTLTNLEHEQPKHSGRWHLRVEMNTEGILLDIRILQQNDSARAERESR